MTYPEVIKYLDSFIDYEKIPQYPYRQSFKLERIKGFLKILNNPQENLKCIHVAGTKGKGSTCAFIAYILRQANLRVGLYTSPHLSDFRERIRILEPDSDNSPVPNSLACQQNQHKPEVDFEGMISQKELIDLIEESRPCINEYNAQSNYGALSFFEVYTALAFKYFQQKRVDLVVLETGLGGRLDATNTVNSLIAVITSISYEHTKHLGGTLVEIAKEKAGIIKSSSQLAMYGLRSIVLSAPQDKEVMKIIKESCQKKNAHFYEVGRDIIIKQEYSGSAQCFSISGALGKLANLRIRLLGKHQLINAALATAVILVLNEFYQLGLKLEAIKNGLYNTIWPGRFEIIQSAPLVVLDGAQNSASSQALRQTVIENFPNKHIILVLGISQDKDIKGICKELCGLTKEIILTQANNPRATKVEFIQQIIKNQEALEGIRLKQRMQITKTNDVKEAIRLATQKANREDLILISGSLFLVGEARDLFIKPC
ncbi:MAG: folylpolyglutamate synthase/dihydrofolate synthase family protein [Candidatus Omnitrophota bacterium]|jgi:dihydrofolate synthase/folylpolyglutamate synthase